MIDIETLSTEPNGVVLSIGACKFTPDGEIVSEFYQNITPVGQKELGLHVCKETIEWWKQFPEAAATLKDDQVDAKTAWNRFFDWYGNQSLETWARGASFDFVILRQFVKAIYGQHAVLPWRYWDERCQRTIEAFHPMPDENREGNHHNALDDAITQAKHVIDFYSKFGRID